MAGDVVTTSSEAPILRDDYRGSRSSKQNAHPKKGAPVQHSHGGRVVSIDQHHSNSKHATITVRHGKQKRDKNSGDLNSYSQAETRMTIPKAHAKNYTLGQKVNVGISPSDNAGAPGEDENSSPGEVPEKVASTFEPGKKNAVGNKKTGREPAKKGASGKGRTGKSSAKQGKAKKTAKGPSPIQQAMIGRR